MEVLEHASFRGSGSFRIHRKLPLEAPVDLHELRV